MTDDALRGTGLPLGFGCPLEMTALIVKDFIGRTVRVLVRET